MNIKYTPKAKTAVEKVAPREDPPVKVTVLGAFLPGEVKAVPFPDEGTARSLIEASESEFVATDEPPNGATLREALQPKPEKAKAAKKKKSSKKAAKAKGKAAKKAVAKKKAAAKPAKKKPAAKKAKPAKKAPKKAAPNYTSIG